MRKKVYNIDISDVIGSLEKASYGEDVRQALIYSLEVLNATHHRRFWENENSKKGETNG